MKDISLNDWENNLKEVGKTGFKTLVGFGRDLIGGETPTIIAGPCRVESYEQMKEIAEELKKNDIKFMRAGVYKPCTFPYADTGMEKKGLEILAKIKKEYKLHIVTEIMQSTQWLEAEKVVDVIQIGARNMQNYNLLADMARTYKPILLKRHPGASLRDFLGAAEWIYAQGNDKVILCERGVGMPYTHHKDARWGLDITIIPAIQKHTHLPIVIDPSHSGGIRDFVPALWKAGIAAGADGVLVEIHPNPDKAQSDALQHIDFKTFRELVKWTRKYRS